MRQALAPHPSEQVPIIPQNPVESAIKSKKEKKSRRSRLSSTIRLYDKRISKAYFYACTSSERHASSPSLMTQEIPDASSLQALQSPAKSKKSTGKSLRDTPRHKSISSKHNRDASSSTIVPSIAEPGNDEANTTSGLENGKSTNGRMKRSHSHSGAKLFEQLFHKRCKLVHARSIGYILISDAHEALHRSSHRNTISVPNPTHMLNSHSMPATPLVPSPQASGIFDRPDHPILDPMSILRDMEFQISNLRHQHSSMLTLLPLSVLSSSRSNTLTDSETSSGSLDGSEDEYFGTPTQGSRRPSLMSDNSRSPRPHGSSLISPKARSARLDSLPSEPASAATERVRFGEPQMRKQRDNSPRRHGHRHTHGRHHTDSDREHRRKANHKSRASLSSLYAEVASIYYDAEVGDESEEGQAPAESSGRSARHSTHHAEELERVLQQEVSRRSENSHEAATHVVDGSVTPDASDPATPKPLAMTQNTPTANTALQQVYSGPIVRRTALPAPAPKSEPSLIGMLKKNVGKVCPTSAGLKLWVDV